MEFWDWFTLIYWPLLLLFQYANIRTIWDIRLYTKAISHSFDTTRNSLAKVPSSFSMAAWAQYSSSNQRGMTRLEEILEHYQHLKSITWRRHIWYRMTFRNPLDLYPEAFRSFLDWHR